MNNKTQYKTKQKTEIMDYLISMSGTHVTVSDVSRHFEKKGNPIGVTTIYRQLDRLAEEGVVNKYITDSTSPACYEYVEAEHKKIRGGNCYHCKCDKCGKLVHLHCEEIEDLIRHIEKNHKFSINPRKTIFYGLCDECRENEKDAAV